MNLFRALLGHAGRADRPPRPIDPTPNVEPVLLSGADDLAVVGESHYRENLRRIVGYAMGQVRVSIIAVLVAETDNHHDPSAVAVWVSHLQVGYLSREDAP